MLALAEQAVARAGLENVETRVLDARDLNLEPESFDAAIARLAKGSRSSPRATFPDWRRLLGSEPIGLELSRDSGVVAVTTAKLPQSYAIFRKSQCWIERGKGCGEADG
jgi:ubiquinone/menaquinone biosynthesis C-methylase UbiE